ncbi:hypothetical protein BDZ85DRAFT_107162 [Elsinoe ampelina]|uniref:Uncharacterized protein n=1 Tax=Elsinoe ampelina TaxID=302913 RepID=A0A6A6GCL4_9PEZI|nr:hypothetical protein BDZ85DRAFT_107162 [Elsinoe ampelina]
MLFPAITILALSNQVSRVLARTITINSTLAAGDDSILKRQTDWSTLLGPILTPSDSRVVNIDVSIVTFNDEVVDMSNVAIFGNVVDGNVVCTNTVEAGDEIVVGEVPSAQQVGGITSITVSLLTFVDEVVDISNVAIFGDVTATDCE